MPVPGAPARPPRAWRSAIGAVVTGAVLTAVLTYPTARYVGSVGRFDTGDGRFSIWNVAWVAHAILDDPRHLFDANIFYPHTSTLTYSELNLFAGAIAAPVYAATRNPVAAFNSAVLLSLLLSFVAMWALTRRLTGSVAAAYVAATGYTFSAYTAAHTAHIQLLMIFGFPLIMLAFHRLVERPTALNGAWLGAALALTALASGYYGVFAGGVIGVAVIFWGRWALAYWKAIAVAALVTAALVLPVLVPYVRLRAAAGPLRGTTIDELRFYSATVRDYITTGTIVGEAGLRVAARIKRAARPALSLPVAKEVLFPGAVISVLAAMGLIIGLFARGDRRVVLGYLLIGVLAAWASLGPDGTLYLLLMKVLPGSSMLRAPARLGIIVTFALAVLAAFAVRRVSNGRAWLGPALVAAIVVESWVPWNLQAMPPSPQAYSLLASLPRGGVVEFPFSYIRTDFHQHTRAMVRSMENWQPLVNGYSDFTPPDFLALAVPINGFPDAESFRIMRDHGVKYVIVRVSDYGGDARQRLLDRFPPYDRNLRRLTADQDVWLYEIVAWP